MYSVAFRENYYNLLIWDFVKYNSILYLQLRLSTWEVCFDFNKNVFFKFKYATRIFQVFDYD